MKLLTATSMRYFVTSTPKITTSLRLKGIINYFKYYLSIENFVVRNGFYPSESDINAIFRRLDIDRDGKISFDEFKKVISYQNYSNITGLKDEELNPQLLSYNSKTSYLDSNNYMNSNIPISSKDLEYKNSYSSFKNKKEKIDLNVIRGTEGSNNNNRYEDNPVSMDHTNRLQNIPIKVVSETVNTYNTTGKVSTLEREFNKVSPKKTRDRMGQKASTSNLLMPNSLTTSFLNKNYILLEEEAFVEMLKDIIEMNKEVELLKCDLAICNDYNLLDSFRYFQASNRDFLYASDIKNGLKILELAFSDEEIELFVRRYDCTRSKVI